MTQKDRDGLIELLVNMNKKSKQMMDDARAMTDLIEGCRAVSEAGGHIKATQMLCAYMEIQLTDTDTILKSI